MQKLYDIHAEFFEHGGKNYVRVPGICGAIWYEYNPTRFLFFIEDKEMQLSLENIYKKWI